jgi:hypothetical protein
MITIRKNMINRVGFSLSELSIFGEPSEYRMEFTCEDSNVIKYTLTKTPVNVSNRLQEFEIVEGVEIDFEVTGFYSYEIYQTTSDNLVEVGLLRVIGTPNEIQTVQNSKSPQVYGN